MNVEQVDRKAILHDDDNVIVYLKETQSYLDDDWRVLDVTNFRARHVAIVEIDGRCYGSMPCGKGALTGILYETRDSFDELVARYGDKNAGSNAPDKEE